MRWPVSYSVRLYGGWIFGLCATSRAAGVGTIKGLAKAFLRCCVVALLKRTMLPIYELEPWRNRRRPSNVMLSTLVPFVKAFGEFGF